MNPFTVFVCAACTPEQSATLDALRATVRRCPHGMLITTGCAAPAPGAVTVVVQPCGVDRRPAGPARRLGAIGAANVDAVCRWLERGDWDAPPSVWWDARNHVSSWN